ncbi:MAG: hypothetical protein LBE60_15430 [Microbacterium sp.]|jgi:N-acetyl-gamma-glutamylphosphate reductase|uniref:hypothetical protein n=1 Tax=Microbacterium sp. TaxID=51671 RepID=UPI00281A2789|nr:hypothetical protein [Microbacterium sp.]MDR2323026.1 hypothetical protein [Microbacterium sp.]
MEVVSQEPLPPFVSVPAEPSDDHRMRIDIRRLANGQKAIVVCSALDRLLRGAGADAPMGSSSSAISAKRSAIGGLIGGWI